MCCMSEKGSAGLFVRHRATVAFDRQVEPVLSHISHEGFTNAHANGAREATLDGPMRTKVKQLTADDLERHGPPP